jgi:hypothetical protein
MNEELIATLGEAEREAQRIPERWRRLSLGEATQGEVEALRQEAARDPEASLMWARFAPLDAAEDEALVTSLLEARTRGSRRRGLRTARWGAAGLAAAAAAALVVATRPGGRLPEYQLEAGTPDLMHRGAAAPPEVPRHHTGSVLALVVRPAAPVAEPVAVQAFLQDGDGAQPLDAAWEISTAGAARLEARVSALMPGRRGALTLVAVVRPAAAPPVSAEALAAAIRADRPPDGTRWARYRMQVVED